MVQQVPHSLAVMSPSCPEYRGQPEMLPISYIATYISVMLLKHMGVVMLTVQKSLGATVTQHSAM